jgi:hypothetical protein
VPDRVGQVVARRAVELERMFRDPRRALQRGHHVAHLVDRDHHVERARAGVMAMKDPDQLEFAGLARYSEHRRARTAEGQQRIDDEVVVIPIALHVVIVGRDHLAHVGGLKLSEREAFDLDDVACE